MGTGFFRHYYGVSKCRNQKINQNESPCDKSYWNYIKGCDLFLKDTWTAVIKGGGQETSSWRLGRGM